MDPKAYHPIGCRFIGSDGWDSPDLSLPVVDGCYFTTHYFPGEPRPEVAAWIQRRHGVSVDPATARYRYEHQGRMYYFCAPGCKKVFLENPDKYLRSSK